jgi:hypothetical protein
MRIILTGHKFYSNAAGSQEVKRKPSQWRFLNGNKKKPTMLGMILKYETWVEDRTQRVVEA